MFHTHKIKFCLETKVLFNYNVLPIHLNLHLVKYYDIIISFNLFIKSVLFFSENGY